MATLTDRSTSILVPNGRRSSPVPQDRLLDLWGESRPTLLLVTHDIEEALFLAARVAVMRLNPGRTFDIALPRQRKRTSPDFGAVKRDVLRLLNSTLASRKTAS